MKTCLNCKNQFEGNYCNNCGQKASTHRFSLKHVFHELPHVVFHVDRGIFKNVRSIINPRKSVTEYLEGKRVGYFNPIFFFLITTGLIIFIEHLLHKEIQFHLTVNLGRDYDAGAFLSHYLKYIYFAFGLLLALPYRMLFHKNTGFNYAEQVVASSFVLGYVNITYLIFVWLPWVDGFPLNFFILVPLYIFTVLVFNRTRLWLTALKALLSVAVQFVLFLAFTLFIALIYGLFLTLTGALPGH